ncbi:MAG: DoxX family protein [Bryobacterales bacterium]|nr:DoxX-like family protein [Bryobacteraceae bacterium]MDW8129316.1 DoxX family protein [Bryobacterales bacterium]
MEPSMAQAGDAAAIRVPAAWKGVLGALSAVLLGLLFLVAGVWKITDPMAAAERMRQALVPPELSLPAAVGFGIAEAVAGAWLIVPRFRRWGAWLAGAMLVAFLAYMGVNYGALRGEECNCFPWVRRAVGPAFFVSDLGMLLMAVAAGVWARPSSGRRGAAMVAAVTVVFALVSFGVAAVRETTVTAPATILVEGQPFSLERGRVFLYFFDPECAHCDQAARWMSQYRWRNVALIGVPTAQPEFAREFLQSTGLAGRISTDADRLRQVFRFLDPPYAVALENGRQRLAFHHFDREGTQQALRRIGFVE